MKYKAYIFDIYGTLFYNKDNNNLERKDKIINGFVKLNKNLNKLLKLNNNKKYLNGINNKYDKKNKNNKNYKNIKSYNNKNLINVEPEDNYRELINLIKLTHKRIKEKNPEIIQPEINIIKFWQEFFTKLYNIDIDEKQALTIAMFFENIVNKVYLPKIGIKILKFIRNGDKDKIPFLGIVSNAQIYTEKLLLKFLKIDDLSQYFHPDLTFFSYKLGVAKPDPAIYSLLLKNLKKLGIDPSETIFIGNDIKNDIEVPARYGFKTCFINPIKNKLLQDTMEAFQSNKKIKNIINNSFINSDNNKIDNNINNININDNSDNSSNNIYNNDNNTKTNISKNNYSNNNNNDNNYNNTKTNINKNNYSNNNNNNNNGIKFPDYEVKNLKELYKLLQNGII